MKTFRLLLICLCTYSFSASARPESSRYTADTARCRIHWYAKKLTGHHEGLVTLSSGWIIAEQGKLLSGDFEINMTGMTNTDLTSKSERASLMDHLKNDFFEIARFPHGHFILTAAKDLGGGKCTISGRLTVKGVSHDITFPATLSVTDHIVNTSATIVIDRADYGIIYGTSFLKKMADKSIDKSLSIQVDIVATR